MLIFVTGLLTLLPVSLVEHEHARQAEIGILELLQVSGFTSCLALITSTMIAFSFLGPMLHVEGAPFNLDSSGVTIVLSCSTVACCQLSHFPDSLAVIPGFAGTVSLVEHEHVRQAEIGIFELFQESGFISCLALTTLPMIAFSFLCPTLQTHVEGAPFSLDSSGVSMVFSCSTVACCGFTTVVSDSLSCVRRCRRTWKVRPSAWTAQVSAWSSPVRLWLVV